MRMHKLDFEPLKAVAQYDDVRRAMCGVQLL